MNIELKYYISLMLPVTANYQEYTSNIKQKNGFVSNALGFLHTTHIGYLGQQLTD